MRERSEMNPPAAMRNTDALNQIRRSNNEAIPGCGSREEEKEKYLERIHFRLAGTMDRQRFESRQVKLERRWHENLRNIHFPARVVDSLQRLHFQFPASARYPGHGDGSKRTIENGRERERKKERESTNYI